MEVVIFLLLAFACVGFSAWRGYVRSRQLNMLVDHGLPTQARITAKHVFRRGPVRYRIVYDYETPQRTLTRSSFVTRDRYRQLEVGQGFPVRYLREDPKVAAPEFLLDRIRAAGQRSAR